MEELLSEKDRQNLADYIQKQYDFNGGKEMRFVIEVVPGSVATDVKISTIEDDNLYRTTNVTSVIDWDNYDF